MNLTQVLKEYQALKPIPGTEGWTVNELKEQLGWGRDRILAFIHDAIKLGRMKCVKRRSVTIDGRTALTPAYVWLKGKKK